jgi:hypothetical protein
MTSLRLTKCEGRYNRACLTISTFPPESPGAGGVTSLVEHVVIDRGRSVLLEASVGRADVEEGAQDGEHHGAAVVDAAGAGLESERRDVARYRQ